MNLRIFKQSNLLANLNKSLADQKNQLTSFLLLVQIKKSEKPNKPNPGFSQPSEALYDLKSSS